MRRVLVLLVLLAACAPARPTREQCKDMVSWARHIGVFTVLLEEPDRDLFVDRCPAIMTRDQVECGNRAGSIEAFYRCFDPEAVRRELGDTTP